MGRCTALKEALKLLKLLKQCFPVILGMLLMLLQFLVSEGQKVNEHLT